ncbi:hypothetical protein [Plantactinospora sp. BB1]|uniref:hypothetical protein n=1 Tax=Plantactinospora sp. BB1 TaxID=2071627 RepID=UPI000D168620|nr:hypothetical protein [Plantactinospora sp. BB1]AVT41039.1 hypothetical protein C6W10_36845 [Plantactinospora sp. BB1]
MYSTFIAYPQVAASLVELFDFLFSPTLVLGADERHLRSQELVTSLNQQLAARHLLPHALLLSLIHISKEKR